MRVVRVCPSVSQTVVQHLLGTCHSSPSLLLSFHQGHPPPLRPPPPRVVPEDRPGSTALLVKTHNSCSVRYRGTFSAKSKKGKRPPEKAGVSARPSGGSQVLVEKPRWLSGPARGGAACWARQLSAGLQQTRERKKGCASQNEVDGIQWPGSQRLLKALMYIWSRGEEEGEGGGRGGGGGQGRVWEDNVEERRRQSQNRTHDGRTKKDKQRERNVFISAAGLTGDT